MDVQQYCQQCRTCQETNDAKFQKVTAPLHPIPVKSKVWNQVCNVIHYVWHGTPCMVHACTYVGMECHNYIHFVGRD